MQIQWIIQKDCEQLKTAIQKTKHILLEIDYQFFTSELLNIDINKDKPFVFYGSVNFIDKARESYQQGIFENKDAFTYDNWVDIYGNLLLNSPDSCKISSILDFYKLNRNPEDYIFIRPKNDSKIFNGNVCQVKDFNRWYSEVERGCYPDISPNTPIVIGKPYGIAAEWRFLIGNQKIISSSQYKKKGVLFQQNGSPKQVSDFVESVILKHNPADVYVLDVGESGGNYYIIEAQSFHSAGMYKCNVDKVVETVSEITYEKFKSLVPKRKMN